MRPCPSRLLSFPTQEFDVIRCVGSTFHFSFAAQAQSVVRIDGFMLCGDTYLCKKLTIPQLCKWLDACGACESCHCCRLVGSSPGRKWLPVGWSSPSHANRAEHIAALRAWCCARVDETPVPPPGLAGMRRPGPPTTTSMTVGIPYCYFYLTGDLTADLPCGRFCWQRLMSTITDHGGDVLRLAGDALIVAFTGK